MEIEAVEASAREGAGGQNSPQTNGGAAQNARLRHFRRQVDGANSLVSRYVTGPDMKPPGNGSLSILALADTGVACAIAKLIAGIGPGHRLSTVGGSPGFWGRVNLVGATASMGR
jgi:hypothetical protein